MSTFIQHSMSLTQVADVMFRAASDPTMTPVYVCPAMWDHLQASLYPICRDLVARNRIEILTQCECHNSLRDHSSQFLPQPRISSESPSEGITDCRPIEGRLLESKARGDKLRSIHRGETLILIGNGPSLGHIDLRRFEGCATMGCNKIYLIEKLYRFRPTYYVAEDRLVIEDSRTQLLDYHGPIKLLPIDRFGLDDADVYYPLWRAYDSPLRFSREFMTAVYSGGTVMFVMLQFAAFLGFKRIILFGVDGNQQLPIARYDGPVGTSLGSDANHFDPDYYGPGQRFHLPNETLIKQAYELAKVSLAKSGCDVFNANLNSSITTFPKASIGELGL